MSETYQENFTVRYREADRYGKLRLASWFDFMQECAATHAEKIGVGYEALKNMQLLWVLAALRLHLDRHPAVGEEITVLTYPSGFNRIFATREFRLSCGGCQIGTASSAWLALSSVNYHPKRLSALGVDIPENPELPRYFDVTGKLRERELPDGAVVPVRYSMEDVNGHMNNAEYAALVQDFAATLNPDEPADFDDVELHYLNSARHGDTLSLSAEQNHRQLFVQGKLPDGTAAFTAEAMLTRDWSPGRGE